MSIAGISGGGNQFFQNVFSKIDTNSDGSVSKEEFVSGRPQGVDESAAAEMFSKLDSEGDGKLSQQQFIDGIKKNPPPSLSSAGLGSNLSSDLLSALLQIGEDDSKTATKNTNTTDSVDQLFSSLDADGNGALSKEEFASGRPQGVSESFASSLFDQIDSDGKDGVSQAEFKAGGPPGGPPPGGPPGGDQSASTSSTDDDTDDTLLEKLVAAIEAYAKNSTSNKQSTDATLLASV